MKVHGNTIHGMTYGGKPHPIYRAWHQMKERCIGSNPEYKKNYTDRGIIVCPYWINNFFAFYKWAIENGWQKGLSLDRKENAKNYSPDNCRWVTSKVQNRNKRSNHIINAFNESKTAIEWSEDSRCKVTYEALIVRINKWKWEVERAIITPKMNSGNTTKRKAA